MNTLKKIGILLIYTAIFLSCVSLTDFLSSLASRRQIHSEKWFEAKKKFFNKFKELCQILKMKK